MAKIDLAPDSEDLKLASEWKNNRNLFCVFALTIWWCLCDHSTFTFQVRAEELVSVRSFLLHRAPQGSLRILLARIFPDASIPLFSAFLQRGRPNKNSRDTFFGMDTPHTRTSNCTDLKTGLFLTKRSYTCRRSCGPVLVFVGFSISLLLACLVNGAAPLNSGSARYLIGDTGEGMTGCVT